jgi:hypothetical protein
MPAKTKSTSPAKAAAARANGRKSNGPISVAGKQKSSRNSLKHGATCSSRTPLLLPGESADWLQGYIDAFYQHLCPKNLAEAALVDTLIAQIWKTARITNYEAQILTSEAEDLHASLAEDYHSITVSRLFALAFQESSPHGKSAVTLRYLVSARNMFRSALSDFIRLRQARGTPEPTDVPPPSVSSSIPTFCINPEALPITGLNVEIIVPSPKDAVPDAEPPETAFHYSTEPPSHPSLDPEPLQTEPEPEQPPMVPRRDEAGFIVLNTACKPIMLRNKLYNPKPGAPPTSIPDYDISHFPHERFNTKLVRDLDSRLTSDGRFRNEPNW